MAPGAKIPETATNARETRGASRRRRASSPQAAISESGKELRSLRWVLAARGLRAFGDGFVSLLLPLYLLSLGYSPVDVGIIATATLLGSGTLTLALGLHAHRFRTRMLLLGGTALMTATGLAFAAITDFWPLLVVAVVGTLNPSSGD
ncbi:MAG TPA: hypothetical protein VLI21_05935, partial [Casimicrobiaceae bacterium]|nr:hypothetical protein [Casimicrobiaceae bacterium]